MTAAVVDSFSTSDLAPNLHRFLNTVMPVRRCLTLARSSYNGRESDDDAESGQENMEGHGADPMKIKLDDLHQILRISEECENDSQQQKEEQIDKLSLQTSSVIARWSVKFPDSDGRPGIPQATVTQIRSRSTRQPRKTWEETQEIRRRAINSV